MYGDEDMNKKFIAIGIVFVFLMITFSGCNDLNLISSDNGKFIGTWVSEIGETLTYMSDGTLIGTN